MRRLFLATLLAFSLIGAFAPAAHAGDQWCETDPVMIITTPGGSQVPIYVNNGAQNAEHLPSLATAKMSYTAAPAENGQSTLVRMTVVVPDDVFSSSYTTRSVVSSGPLETGTDYATTYGTSGQPMVMAFLLPVR